MFHVLFLTFELMFFNGFRNMKSCRKFHFAGIYLSKFIFRLEFEKNSRFFRVLNSNSILNSKLWYLKWWYYFFLVCCSIPSIELVQKILTGYHLLVHNYYHLLKCKKSSWFWHFSGVFFNFWTQSYGIWWILWLLNSLVCCSIPSIELVQNISYW